MNATTSKNRHGTISIVQTPLFPCMIFASLSEHDINIIKQTDGFLHFLYWKAGYAIVSREDIKLIRDFCNEHEVMRVEKCPVQPEQRVEVDLYSPLKKAAFQSRNKSATGILIGSLGYMLAAVAQKERVDLLHQAI